MPHDAASRVDLSRTGSLARRVGLAARRRRRHDVRRDEAGFTLIELLVVVVIIGILIAIAIPLYLNYKKGANDKAAQSDLRNAISTLESCATDNGSYPTTVVTNTANGVCSVQRINISSGTSVFVYAPATGSTPGSYVLESSAGTSGNGKYFCYDSKVGGAVRTVTAAVTSAATACPSA